MGPPLPATLKRYGMTADDWLAMYARADGRCEICRSETRRLVIDHGHVKGWKKMKPAQRRAHVRGLICWLDNLYLVGRGVTPERLRAALAYLARHEVGLAG